MAKDEHMAFDWYRRAADNNDLGAIFNTGICYKDGTGVARDLREARRWFERAAAAGHALAKEALVKLDALEAQ